MVNLLVNLQFGEEKKGPTYHKQAPPIDKAINYKPLSTNLKQRNYFY